MNNRKNEFDEEQQAFLPEGEAREDASAPASERRSTWRRPTSWFLRLALEVAMAFTIISLVISRRNPADGSLRKSPVPKRTHPFTCAPQQSLHGVGCY